MFESGAYVADHVDPVGEEQIQPNGVDLTLETVFEQVEPGRLRRDGKTVGERRELDPEGGPGDGEDEGENVPTYALDAGGYVARYAETIRVPEGHVGFVLPRSSLMRNSCMLNTAVWDAGYEGRGEGLLQVHHSVEIERGARFAQLVFARADHEDSYDGSYQGENL